ncbi:MAG: hypothetical protein LH605_03235, partial [Microbacteriaceae bacterium]|nr:hypothetical protein [Microbacteriaceae bacterium]
RTSVATTTANAATFTVPPTALRDGTNVVTASTHLNFRSTTDLSFDLVDGRHDLTRVARGAQ